MNRDQKKRITQNITYLKERLIDLDPILDILIEKDVLSIDDRTKVEQVFHPTSQRKFNEFVQILLASPEPSAYDTFIEALNEGRYFQIVERLQNTIVKDGPGYTYVQKQPTIPGRIRQPRQSTFHGMPSAAASDEAGAAGGMRAPLNSKYDTVATTVQRVLEEFGNKMTEELMTKMSIKHSQEKEDLEWRMEQRLQKFDQEWQTEKQDLIRRNDDAIHELQAYINQIRKSDDEYNQLKEKYEKLQNHQEEMRVRENERWERLTTTNKENVQLRKENEDLRSEIQNLQERIKDHENDKLVAMDNEKQDRLTIEQLMAANAALKLQLEEKERDIVRLKQELQTAYTKIQQTVLSQKENSNTEDPAYIEALARQSEKLEEIYAAVNDLTSRERGTGILKPGSRGLHVVGSGMPRKVNRPNNNQK